MSDQPTPPTATSSATTPSVAKPEEISPIAWSGDTLRLLDQTLLPDQEVWLDCVEPEQVADAIRRLAVRGAPAIGVAAGYGLVVGLSGDVADDDLQSRFDAVYELLAGTRPTAVNLRWALERGRGVFDAHRDGGPSAARRALLDWAQGLHARDVETNRRLGDHGVALFAPGDRVLTHCNAGALATAGYGTAVGVITSAFRAGRVGKVWVDETRPLLQGARLTSWEMERLQIPYRLVTDSSVGALMSRGMVDRVVVGADRIAANGDTANKIGTYVVAVLAARHGVPFYVAAPTSTIDPRTPSGSEIPIEERASEEVTHLGGHPVAPEATRAMNFAFDVTPHELIAGIVTEVGVLEPPFEDSIGKALAEAEGDPVS
ncbi:MAG: S-methyl-5-thioribose-1-phosphate isomerase [Acidobacteriota bacterium]